MKNESFKKLAITKIKLLFTPCYKRQKYIDDLVMYLLKYKSEFNEEAINELIEQKESLSKEDEEKLFSMSFDEYDLLKFGETRLSVDKYHPEDCRTFAQFNEALKIILMISDFEENLILQEYENI